MSGFGTVFGQYARRAIAYRWLVMVPAVLVFALVTFYLSIQPDTWEATGELAPQVSTAVDRTQASAERTMRRKTVQSANERLLSNDVLGYVIEQLDPYPELMALQGREACIAKLRRRFRIEVLPRAEFIRVTATHDGRERPAEMVADLVNTMLEYFVKGLQEEGKERVLQEKRFSEEHERKLRERLDKALVEFDNFVADNKGSLPDDVPTNLGRIDRLDRDIDSYRRMQREYGARINALKRSNARLEAELEIARKSGTQATTSEDRQAAEAQLRQRKVDLDVLLDKYEEDHENVREVKSRIAALEKLIAQLKNAEKTDETLATRTKLMGFLIADNKTSIKQHEEEIEVLGAEIANTRKEIERLEGLNRRAAEIKSAYLKKQREVDAKQQAHDRIRNRLNGIREMVERKDWIKEAPIQVHQRAFVPAKPAGPDRLVTSLIGLALGLGIGIGLAVAVQKMDKSYQRPEDLRGLLPGAVLVTIPEVRGSGVRIGRTLVGILGGLALIGIFVTTMAVVGIQAGWWGEMDWITPLTDLR